MLKLLQISIRENDDKNTKKKAKENSKTSEAEKSKQGDVRFSEKKDEKDIKIRRKMKAESADPDSVDEADL